MVKDYDLVCFSHLRWDFVFQRPQHLLTRFSKKRRVFYVEEPIFGDFSFPVISSTEKQNNLFVVTPQMPKYLNGSKSQKMRAQIISDFFGAMYIKNFVSWYYTPMALPFTKDLKPLAVVYDCMDELSLFKDAPPNISFFEKELFKKADVVFTGGKTLYEAKKNLHSNIFPFPSSIDRAHFAKARDRQTEPLDQKHIPHPRLGFFGVVDERLDTKLLSTIAKRRPDWHFIIIGPVLKINPRDLPQRDNIHYLGAKSYEELPQYLAGWDVSMLLFALNDATKYISPTKTPEYLAAGKAVVSTPIRDVVYPYGEKGLVKIASGAEQFVEAAEDCMKLKNKKDWLFKVDTFLANNSWDNTWEKMAFHVNEVVQRSKKPFGSKNDHMTLSHPPYNYALRGNSSKI